MRKLILVELNEINFDIVSKYSKKIKFKFFTENFLNNLKTTSSEKEYSKLEPWIQWVSAHTGKSASEHKVFRLGDIGQYNEKQIFEIVEDLGFDVGAICPMNTKNSMKNPKYFFSDPWTQNEKLGENKKLEYAISSLVNNNSNNKNSIINYFIFIFYSIKIMRFKVFIRAIGLFFLSFYKKWKRALILDLFLHELHLKFIKKFKPDFSTVFFNSGAHIQHHYFFLSKEINKEKLELPKKYTNIKYDPILDMYLFYDKILSDYSSLNYNVVIATGLSQIPYDRVKYYYRPIDHKTFLYKLNIKPCEIYPRMSRDFLIEFESEKDALNCEETLKLINYKNKFDVFYFENRGKTIFITFKYDDKIDNSSFIFNSEGKKIFLDKLVSFVAIKNGMHSEKGYLSLPSELVKHMPKNNHVKNIFQLIYNYFSNIYAKN